MYLVWRWTRAVSETPGEDRKRDVSQSGRNALQRADANQHRDNSLLKPPVFWSRPGDTDWLEGDCAPEEARSAPQWSEERCEELWERVEGVRHKITRILNPAKLTPYLRQCKVIDEEDEDEVLNSTQYPLRISKAGRLLDILRAQGQRGLQAFMESLEFYHPEQYTQLTGKKPTHRCSLILDEEGPEGLTQFLLLEVRKLREQLRNSRMCERRLSQRCRMAEEERSRAEHKAQELRHDKLLLERLRQDWETASRELGKLKDRHLEQAVKYSRALEEQGQASSRERELLRQVGLPSPGRKPHSVHHFHLLDSQFFCLSQALMDILQQDRREAAEQRQELCEIITRLQGELQATEENRAKVQKTNTHKKRKEKHCAFVLRSYIFFLSFDQALRSRDSLQLEYTDCLLDKNRLRKHIAELQANLEQQQRELERERERCREQMQQSPCLNCVSQSWTHTQLHPVDSTTELCLHIASSVFLFPQSHLSLCSEDQCFGPCCSLDLDLNSEKEINRLSTFPFPPCVNSINRRFHTEKPPSPCSPPSSPSTSPKLGRASLADDITIVGGNRTGIFVSHVKAGSPAEQCGLKEGCELLEVRLCRRNFSYSKLRSELSSPSFAGADSFYARVNLNMEPHGDPPTLAVSCDDIIHVTDTRHNGRYQWRCSLVNRETAVPLQTGTMPNYNRWARFKWVLAVLKHLTESDWSRRWIPPVGVLLPPSKFFTLSANVSCCSQSILLLSVRSVSFMSVSPSAGHEDHLIPYSLVKPVKVQTKRPVIFSPSLLSRRLIERLLQPAESGLNFNTCPPGEGHVETYCSLKCPEQALGIRLESIQDVISQGRHCLLELGLPSVEALLRQGIYPIVIHIRPKNKKHKKLRKLFPRCGEDSIMEEVCQAEELQLETLPLLYYTVEPSTWSCTEELLEALRNAVHRQQGAVAWVELDRLQ
uniref:CARD domain-containing protein n=1 Tax=Poecilia latipinna TaxID=48699 RepID=A0A3B3V2H9_9TELE